MGYLFYRQKKIIQNLVNADRVQWQLLKSQRFIEHAKKWGHQTSEQAVFQKWEHSF